MNRPPFLAARERSGQRVTIGFAGIADFRSVIGQEYIAGVTKAAVDYGVNLINFAGAIKYSVSGDIDFFRHYAKKYRFMRPNVIDGLVTWASSLSVFMGYEAIRALHEKLKPLPMVDLGVPVLDGVPGVTIRTAEGIRLVMDHLRDHGYRRIGFVGCSAGRQYQERLDAWRAELARNGWEEDPGMVGILDSLEARDIHRWVESFAARYDVRQRREVDALVTVSDVSAAILVDELSKRGIQVPRDLAVTGFNNQIQSVGSACPITTVDLAYFNRGYAAVKLLLERIEHPRKAFSTLTMESTLVVRQSCGCFEAEVDSAAAGPADGMPRDLAPDELRALLRSELAGQMAGIQPSRRDSLIEALMRDLAGPGATGLLAWLQQALADEYPVEPDRLPPRYQNLVSVVRRTLLGVVDPRRRSAIEDLLHQARVLIALAGSYHERSHRTDAYRFNNLARTAVSLASARTVPEIFDAVRFHLGELDMPGILLVLQDEPTPEMGSGQLRLAYPESAGHGVELPLRIHESGFIPRSCFPRDRPWVMMFQVLSVSGAYLGYALIEGGPAHVALYDAVCTLLSHALYAVHARSGVHPRLRSRIPETGPLTGVPDQAARLPAGRGALDSRMIVDYLMDRLGDMTDLRQMSADLSISKSWLNRRSKALTGFTVQALHERLKIERAKALLETPCAKVAEIAGRLGYQNQSYFSAVFKKCTGLSPREWAHRRF